MSLTSLMSSTRLANERPPDQIHSMENNRPSTPCNTRSGSQIRKVYISSLDVTSKEWHRAMAENEVENHSIASGAVDHNQVGQE
ncbi:hypothetical protein TrispH2_010925 [Trichoplax sp. H2]|nr:hypothetical protein TrispH2_010925 [Trichoplax sp. H2]|eukprot:RDD36820.1 hypothetical protein TrispH2_010925 [Trichoplax sp. H2]